MKERLFGNHESGQFKEQIFKFTFLRILSLSRREACVSALVVADIIVHHLSEPRLVLTPPLATQSTASWSPAELRHTAPVQTAGEIQTPRE